MCSMIPYVIFYIIKMFWQIYQVGFALSIHQFKKGLLSKNIDSNKYRADLKRASVMKGSVHYTNRFWVFLVNLSEVKPREKDKSIRYLRENRIFSWII